jgi:glycerate kinase
MAAAVGGSLVSVPVCGPLGEEVPGAVLLSGSTAYVESAQACGLHLVPLAQRDPGLTTTYGVGQLVAAAVDAGATTVVVGLGGSATNDGGPACWPLSVRRPRSRCAAGPPARRPGRTGRPRTGARARRRGRAARRDRRRRPPARSTRGDCWLRRAEGAAPARLPDLERALGRLADALDPAVAAAPGAGAAGGLGYALLLLGARREHGIAHVMAASGFADRARAADLVVTGEGALDWQSLRGKVVAGVAKVAGDVGRPVVALAGRVEVGRRELAAMGVDAAYALAETPAETRAALDRPAETLEALAARVARTWAHR